MGRKPVKITGARRCGRGFGARLCCIRFCISQFHCLSSVQISPFLPSASLSATKSQSFRFSVSTVSRSAHVGDPQNFFPTGARTRNECTEENYETVEDSDLLRCDDAASRWVKGTRRFEGTWCLHLQVSSDP